MDSLRKRIYILFVSCLAVFWCVQVSGLEIITSDLPDAIVEYFYSTNLAASAGVLPYTWSVTGGEVPLSMALNPTNGLIEGTTTTVGTYNFTIQVTDSTEPVQQTDSKQFSIKVLDWKPQIKRIEQNASGNIEMEWWSKTSDTYAVESSFGPYDTESNMLWTGEATDIVSGGASTSWTDTDPSTPTGEKYYRVYVEVEIEELIILGEYGDGFYNEYYYDDSVTALGGVPPYTWEIESGYLSYYGLYLDPDTGVIYGDPLLTGPVDFEIRVTDSASSSNHVTKEFSIYIY